MCLLGSSSCGGALDPRNIPPKSQSLWDVCLKAAAEGGWVVIQDFEGAADQISLAIDGLHRQSAIRLAAAAAAEEQGKFQREKHAVKEKNSNSNISAVENRAAVDIPQQPGQTGTGRGFLFSPFFSAASMEETFLVPFLASQKHRRFYCSPQRVYHLVLASPCRIPCVVPRFVVLTALLESPLTTRCLRCHTETGN